MEEAVDHILTTSVLSVEDQLTSQLKEKPKIRLFVSGEYIVEDCFSFYKSENFKPDHPIRVVFDGSPAVDAGGLFRQFYSSFFAEITNENDSSVKLFEGSAPFFLPISTAETCLSEIFCSVGKIIAHNICQGGEGFPALAPTVYQYLVTGNIKDSVMDVQIDEVCNVVYKQFINQVFQIAC